MSGFYLMHRGWMEHPVFAPEPFTEREAWVWMIEHAAFKPTRKRAGAHIVSLERGQLVGATRYLAEAWRWSKSRVARFLSRLENEDMIRIDSGTGANVVTICKYDEYQLHSGAGGTESETPSGRERDASGTPSGTNKNEGNEGNELDISSDEEIVAAKRDDAPARMVAIWNEVFVGSPIALPKKLNDARRRKCRARFSDSFGRDEEEWRAYCRSIRGSPFLTGENDRQWRADFDWALKPENILKVQEGKYQPRGAEKQNDPVYFRGPTTRPPPIVLDAD